MSSFGGSTFHLTPNMVHRALADQMPSETHKYWVEVGDVRWPVTEAVSLSTGLLLRASLSGGPGRLFMRW